MASDHEDMKRTADAVERLESAIDEFMEASGQVFKVQVCWEHNEGGSPIPFKPYVSEQDRAMKLYHAYPQLHHCLAEIRVLAAQSGLFWQTYLHFFRRQEDELIALNKYHTLDYETMNAAIALLDIYEQYAPPEVQRIANAHTRESSIVNLQRLAMSLARKYEVAP